MNIIQEEEILILLKQGKDPVKNFIERNKYLASKEYLAKSDEIVWVVDKEIAFYIPVLIEKINKIKKDI